MSTSAISVKDRWLKKIENAGIIDRLVRHYKGELDPPLDAGQIQIGLKLANKFIPDLKSVEVSGEVGISMNRLELEGRLLALGLDPSTIWGDIKELQPNQHVIEHDDGHGDSQSLGHEAQAIDNVEVSGSDDDPIPSISPRNDE